jgi:hypothetical protein
MAPFSTIVGSLQVHCIHRTISSLALLLRQRRLIDVHRLSLEPQVASLLDASFVSTDLLLHTLPFEGFMPPLRCLPHSVSSDEDLFCVVHVGGMEFVRAVGIVRPPAPSVVCRYSYAEVPSIPMGSFSLHRR